MKHFLKSTTFCILLSFILFSCKNDDDSNASSNQIKTYGIFTVINDTTVKMNGEIGNNSKINFDKLISNFPAINRINIQEVPGSMNDQVNLELSKTVHSKNIHTHLENNGLIASGGVDFFLSGTKRTKGTNTKIGVHSWGGEDANGNKVTATDFPVGHEYHLPYIQYYQIVGFTKEDAEAFYYFTINAASFESVHWMTDAEISQYKLLKE
ncbi:hypothetical protein [Aureivirga marina]|uniref:hypothetical protein n=1 Tax=Aureivirga marina TaxID=1182451 RepID=UPI0018C96DEC|nr:hypothetical protein [Aureivirga marina]